MKARKISLKAAKPNKLFYFVANVVVCRASDKRCLILKRSDREITHPGRWALPGGKLEWEDLDLNSPTRLNGDVIDFEDAIFKLLEREALEEAGIKIKGPFNFINDVTFVRPDEIPGVLIVFSALYKSGKVEINPHDFSDFAWVNQYEIKKYDFIDGVDKEVRQTIKALGN
ncbi:MAG TPA: NUDIX hydrolase [Candidatus Saccharimonadales bacterium]|nr:NUDIX hydrolase [Candidatus Saccharimonadales bacterium]